MGINFPGFLHLRGFTAFSMLSEIDEKTHAFPIWWSIPHDGNLMEKTPILLKLYRNQFLRLSQFDGFCCLFQCYGKLIRKHTFPIWWSIPQDGNLMGKKHPYYGDCMRTNFPGFSHLMSFAAFSHVMGNWWENLCFSHMMKYTIGWKSNGKKTPMLWEKYEHQFPSFSLCNGFCCIFTYYGKLMGKPMHLPYDEVYHRMGVGWENSTHTMEKVWGPISQVLPIQWALLHFPVLWEINGETHAFPISSSIPYENWMGKKHPYYGKGMSTNFPDSPYTMGFVAFPHTMGSWWQNPCISHMMRFINFFPCTK